MKILEVPIHAYTLVLIGNQMRSFNSPGAGKDYF